MKYIPVLFLFLLLIASCGNNSKTEDQAYEQHKESLAEQEQKNPLHFCRCAAIIKRTSSVKRL